MNIDNHKRLISLDYEWTVLNHYFSGKNSYVSLKCIITVLNYLTYNEPFYQLFVLNELKEKLWIK